MTAASSARPRVTSWLTMAALAFALGACDGDPGAASWRYGPEVDYPIDATGPFSLPDPTSAGTFHFPAGGRGTLTVAPIVAGPLTIPADATAFAVTYTGAEPFELRYLRSPDSATFFHIAGEPTYSTYEQLPEEGAWLPITPDRTDDSWIFPLSAGAAPEARARLGLQTAPATVHCASITMPLTAPPVLQLQIFDAQVKTTLGSLVAKLSSPLQTKVRAAMIAPPLQLEDTLIATDVNAYNASQIGWSIAGFGPRTLRPHFQFVVSGKGVPSASTFAHESGHYLSHLILGDDVFQALEAQRVRVHDLAMVTPGRPLLEEYAQLTDQLVHGVVRNTKGWDLREPIATFRAVTAPSYGPKQVDWPSLEGYGASLMANLMRTSDTLGTGLSGGAEDIPAYALSAADLFDMIAAHAPLTVNQLREAVHLYLGGTLRSDALPALLERTGWSYHAKGRLVDAQQNGIAGAKLQAVCKAPSQGREYLAPLTPATTDGNGYFELDRLFPGGSWLRVTVGTTTQELLIYGEPTDPTTTLIELEDITWVPASSFTRLAVQIEAVRDWNRLVGGDITPGNGIVDNERWLDQVDVRALTVTESTLAASLRWSFTEFGTGYEHALDLACAIGAAGEIAQCPITYVVIERYEGGGIGERRAELALSGIPRATDRPDERSFSCTGLACQGHLAITSETFVIRDAAGAVHLSYEHLPGSIAWDEPLRPPHVLLRLSRP